MGLAGLGLCWSGHGLLRPWSGLAVFCFARDRAGRGLGRERSGLGMAWASHALAWPWSGLDMGWFRHGLGLS